MAINPSLSASLACGSLQSSPVSSLMRSKRYGTLLRCRKSRSAASLVLSPDAKYARRVRIRKLAFSRSCCANGSTSSRKGAKSDARASFFSSSRASRSAPNLGCLAGKVAGGQDHDEGEDQDKYRECHRRVEVPFKFGEDGEGYRLGHALDVSREDDRATELSKRSRPGGDGPSHQSWKRQRDSNLQKDRNWTTPVHQRGLLYTPLYLSETDRRLPNVEVRCNKQLCQDDRRRSEANGDAEGCELLPDEAHPPESEQERDARCRRW